MGQRYGLKIKFRLLMKKIAIFFYILFLISCGTTDNNQNATSTTLEVQQTDAAAATQTANNQAQGEAATTGGWATGEEAATEAEAPSASSLFPKPKGWISDFDEILSVKEEEELTKLVAAYQVTTDREIAIVTTTSIDPYKSLYDYSNDLFNEWGIGNAKKNDGLMMVLCKNRGEVRISTGTGTEKILTNNVCQEIIDKNMIPYLKKKEYFAALKNGLQNAMKQWK